MSADGAPCDCKVGRVASEYGLGAVGEELASLWRGEEGESYSLRDLQHYFNRRVLGAELRSANVEVLDGELENTYRLLTDDDVSAGMRTQAAGRLERDGVDVEAVQKDFVSHQSIHTHLRECLGAEKDPEPADRVASTQSTVGSLEARTEKIAANNLDRLAGEEVSLDGFDVIVTTHVTCDECGRRHEFGELLDAGGCECRVADAE
ncbi:rod-determining factor RdfA [Halarchaeum sp. P4]|uniref:rod-determining factor RdfA n=1 Tax=Halarchaeum sp. P4 TaxID=3421639 RepID=UPI003EBE1FE9